MKRFFLRLLVGALFFAQMCPHAFANVIIVPSDSEVKIPIDRETGSLLQFPSAVKTITSSKYFHIQDVASDVDYGTGTKMDVRLFDVRPLAVSRSENVIFVLGNGRTVKTQLIPAESAEKHYDLVFPNDSKKAKHTKFLQAEIALMTAMIRDEGGDFARQVKESAVTISGFDGVSAKLVRLFAGNGLTGYAFEIRNNSSEHLNVDVSRLSLANGNAAGDKDVLLHAEREKIEPCKLISQPECKTRVFIVTRDQSSFSSGGFGLRQKTAAESNSTVPSAPFVRSDVDFSGSAQ